MPLKSVDYIVIWNWRESIENNTNKRDVVKATTATRAIAKLKENLKAEYSFKMTDLIILEVVRSE